MIFTWLRRRPRLRRVPEAERHPPQLDGLVLEPIAITNSTFAPRLGRATPGDPRILRGYGVVRPWPFAAAETPKQTIFGCEVQHRPVLCGSSCQPPHGSWPGAGVDADPS
jgi:hypothetical protein